VLAGCEVPFPENEPTISPLEQVTDIPEPTATLNKQFRILFIGNSLSYWNNGLAYHMEQLVNSANQPIIFHADEEYELGAPLKTMWAESNAREIIAEGDYDLVVLQDGLPSSDVDTFREYTRRFAAEIREAGAEPVLFMTWARSGFSTEEIAQAYGEVAEELGVEVAPVGLAWQRVIEEDPRLDLFDLDNVHPSLSGTYLVINVFYATIFGETPIGLDYMPIEDSTLTNEQAAYLQYIAWEIVKEYLSQELH
jgi:hypothetical protein